MSSTRHADPNTDAVNVAERTWWVGTRPRGEILHANSFLCTFPSPEGDGEDYHLLIDPASGDEFDAAQARITGLIGGVDQIDALLLNHQDPGISSTVASLLEHHIPQVPVLCTEDTGELLHNYCDIPDSQFVHLEDYPRGMKLPTGDVVIPVAAPFCHFMGATMLYDPATRVLFSGDLFAGLCEPGIERMVAEESDWAGIRAFHQIYMPTRTAVQNAIDAIRRLDPPVEIIAPQHGRIITGDLVKTFMDRLYDLQVGVDVVDKPDAEQQRRSEWTAVLAQLVERAADELGEDRARHLLEEDGQLNRQLHIGDNTLSVHRDGRRAVERAVRLWTEVMERPVANVVKFEAVRAAAKRDLPAPQVDLGEETYRVDGPQQQSQVTGQFQAV